MKIALAYLFFPEAGSSLASQSALLEMTHSDFYSQVAETRDARRFKGTPEQLRGVISDHINPLMNSFGQDPSMDGEALNLANATVAGAVGPALKVPVLRLQLSAVNVWWAARFSVEESRSYSGGVGVGFAF
jgi:hypothetical protein